MNTEQNLLVTISVLPNLMLRLEDLIEQGDLRYKPKQDAQILIRAIERFTNNIFKGMDLESLKQLEEISKLFDDFSELK
jgi:arabinogalactan endo-1,4-beta-galactosidase